MFNETQIQEQQAQVGEAYHPSGAIPFSIGRRHVQLKTLKDVHQEICRRTVAGQKNVEIAAELGITPQTVCNTTNSLLGGARVAELSAMRDAEVLEVQGKIAGMAETARQVMQDILEDEEVGKALRFSVAKDVLDRAGLGAVQKVQRVDTKLSVEDIEKMKARAAEAGILRTERLEPVLDVERLVENV